MFSKKGFHGATVRDIGRAAGLTQGTIYNYVGSKEDILYMTCDRVVAEYTEETRRALALAREPAERVRSAVSALTEVMYRQKAIANAEDKSTRRCLTQAEVKTYNVANNNE